MWNLIKMRNYIKRHQKVWLGHLDPFQTPDKVHRAFNLIYTLALQGAQTVKMKITDHQRSLLLHGLGSGFSLCIFLENRG